MKKRVFCIIALVISIVFFLGFSVWAMPSIINYQGKLTDGDGISLDGVYIVKFYLFTQETGGDSIWSEQQDVVVTEGIYNVELGVINDLRVSFFNNENLYLEVEIFNSGTGWETLSPRQCLTSTAFAMKAASADTLNNRYVATDFAKVSHTHSFTEIAGSVSDAQIPNNITINYAAVAGNADKVDGKHASEFALADHNHDARYYSKTQVESLIATLENRIAQLEDLLQGVTRSGNNIEFSGVNVHIVNGTGTTNGAVNGLGNLIVGYNELRSSGNNRNGSHNIVLGDRQNYSSYGGLVTGFQNTISGSYCSVSGGIDNTASGTFSSVSGGQKNTASASSSSVSGGSDNTASNGSSSVSGGYNNTASGAQSSISGGHSNEATIGFASVTGGKNNTASGIFSSVNGGNNNEASGNYSSISGGTNNTASGDWSSVSGGASNTAGGNSSTVSGGSWGTVSGLCDWRAGGLFEDQ